MTPATVTNVQLMEALNEIRHQIQQRDEPLEAWQEEVRISLLDLSRRIERLESAWTKEARRDACPFRDDIISAANNKGRIISLENKSHDLELQMVRAGMYGGAAGGGVIGLLTMLMYGAGKMFGWW